MTPSNDLNVIFSQSAAVKEIHNVRKQSLETSQQFVAQQAETKKKEQKTKIEKLQPTADWIEIHSDERQRGDSGSDRQPQKEAEEEDAQEEISPGEGKLIDITV